MSAIIAVLSALGGLRAGAARFLNWRLLAACFAAIALVAMTTGLMTVISTAQKSAVASYSGAVATESIAVLEQQRERDREAAVAAAFERRAAADRARLAEDRISELERALADTDGSDPVVLSDDIVRSLNR